MDLSTDFDLNLEGSVDSPVGFLAAVGSAGLRQSLKPDVALIVSQRPCAAAGLFTTNLVVAAPVILCRETLTSQSDAIHGVVINAKNANACTGESGLANARLTQQLAAQAAGEALQEEFSATSFFVLSTGVIGVPLPMEKIRQGIGRASAQLPNTDGLAAARAILTTDTYPKHLAMRVPLSGGIVTMGGMAKGAGMIHPNMATMLAVLTTDAAISAPLLQELLRRAADQSFNCISVDGDTSTNDTLLLLANGASGVSLATPEDVIQFQAALNAFTLILAKMIVQDGEGATKLVTVQVSGAADAAAAKQIANTIATSPLVKTAFAGSDPNWGRIVAAAGRSGVVFDPQQTFLWAIAAQQPPLQLFANGSPTAYQEESAAAIFALTEFTVHLQVGDGTGEAIVYTCDLSQEYVSINADYRT